MATYDIPDGQVIATAPTINDPELQAIAFCVDMIERNIPDVAARGRIMDYLCNRFPRIELQPKE